jgi:hypothetical protein
MKVIILSAIAVFVIVVLMIGRLVLIHKSYIPTIHRQILNLDMIME